ncbi:ABC transporter ATP-binding protein [Gaopeijia maritima]|uniref:ABC transporter ATP-binding protein n=1 Tax=Gaopeijia maritima TaxID=3119007 RepID=A0ABU9E5Z2_9BACT
MTFRARELTVRYPGSDRPALDCVDLVVPEASFYAVLGPNGSGKSTLMRALLGAVKPETGTVRIADRPLADWDRRALARHVGGVPQMESMPFPVSVRDLVAMGRYPHLGALGAERPDDRTAVTHALEHCEVSHLAERDVQTLSGGELQRVRIARALAQQPRALALDEPTASLDIRHEMAILQLLRGAADEGMTVLLITHHLDLAARFADRILLLDRGRVVAEGPPEEVYDAATLEAVYRWPVDVRVDPTTRSPRVIPLAGPVNRSVAPRDGHPPEPRP